MVQELFSAKRLNLTVAVILAAAIMLSCNIIGSSDETVVTKEAAATATVVAEKTPTGAPSYDGGQIEVLDTLYTQNFSGAHPEWVLDPYETENVKAIFNVENGVYSVDVKAYQSVSFSRVTAPRVPLPDGDFLLTVSTQIFTEDEGLASGLAFRFQDFDNHYFARLSQDGDVTAYALENDTWEKLAGPKKADHFVSGEANRLIVEQRNGRYEIQVNDYPVVTFFDFRFRKGAFGLVAELDADTEGKFTFDDIRLMQPGGSAAEREEEAPAAAAPTMMPMGASWMTFEGESSGVKYTIDHPFVFIESTSGGWQQLCLDAPEKLCVSTQAQKGAWQDAQAFADEVLAGFSSAVGDYEEISRKNDISADGYPVVEVHYTYTWQGRKLEGIRRFLVIESTGFDIAAEGEPVMMSVYETVVKNILKSFRVIEY